MKVRAILFLVFACLSTHAQDSVRISIGELTTPVVGPLLGAFAGDQVQLLEQIAQTEIKGKKKGRKYTATLSKVQISGLFQNLPGDRYSIAIGNNGVIAVAFNMPDVEISGRLDLYVAPKKVKRSGGIFGALDPTGFIDGISDTGWNIATSTSDIDQTFKVTSRGLKLGMVIKVDVNSQAVSILSSTITELDIGDVSLDLRSRRDGLLARFANIFSFGSIDNMIEKMVLDQMKGRRIAERMAAPINSLVASGLKIPIIHTFDISPDIKIGNGRELSANEMRVLVPFAFIEQFAENLSQKENLTFSQEMWGVKMTATKNGVIRATAGSEGEILWQVPVEVDATSAMLGNAKTSATVEVRIRPSVEGSGLKLEIVGAKVGEIQSGPLKLAPATALSLVNAALETRLRETFPARELVAANLPVIENVDWNIRNLEISEEGVIIFGSLAAVENPTKMSAPVDVVLTNQNSPRSCRGFLVPSANGKVLIYRRR